MRKHQAEEIAEAGERNTNKGGGEDISPTSPGPGAAPKQPCQVISLSNFEQALMEIILSESLGT